MFHGNVFDAAVPRISDSMANAFVGVMRSFSVCVFLCRLAIRPMKVSPGIYCRQLSTSPLAGGIMRDSPFLVLILGSYQSLGESFVVELMWASSLVPKSVVID